MQEQPTLSGIAKMIDHSLLHPTVSDDDIVSGCQIAKDFNVATVCIKPYCIPQVSELLSGSDVEICSVIGFPHGNSTTAIKVKETEEAASLGSTEIDMVVNIGKVLSSEWAFVSKEIAAINEAAVSNQAILKVIFETDYLEDPQIIKLCEICSEIEVAFVKTSSGYGFVKQDNGMYAYQGATPHNVKLMREHCPESVQIKAAGGVRSLDELLAMRELGATRVGASATKSILEEAKEKGF